MTDLGDAKYYLGVELTHTREEIYFHQKGYIEKLLDRFGMSTCMPLAVPMNPRTKL
jgi:lipid II:glycine glycyltransferase (peptidoglycan interpeptide bridge formation enzyme)